MNSKYINNKKIEKLNLIKSKGEYINIKSDYIMNKIFNNMQKRLYLEIIKYNINIQKRLNININDYKNYSERYSSIELEIISIQNKYGKFINIKEEDKKYFHIYFNNDKKEVKRNILNENEKEKINIIKIIIDYQIISFEALFFKSEVSNQLILKNFIELI